MQQLTAVQIHRAQVVGQATRYVRLTKRMGAWMGEDCGHNARQKSRRTVLRGDLERVSASC